MENNMVEETMDLDLNIEPSDPGLGSLLSELETAHGRIEERIRQLEAVTSRTRQRQRWRQGQSSPQPLNIFVEQSSPSLSPDVSERETSLANAHSEASLFAGDVGFDSQEMTDDDRKIGKRDSSHLVAKALEMDTETKKAGGMFFDCNVCLYMARDPILTCCGHLFCWPCFYQLPYVHENVKECPECKGDLTETSIIPIYGNGSNYSSKSKSKEPVLELPPRPQAHRIESVRQQLISRRSFSSPIEIVNNIISAAGERTRSQQLDGAQNTGERTNALSSRYATSQALPTMEIEGNQRHPSFQVSRMLSQGAASFSSLSSALNSAMDSAERLVEDLAAFISNRQGGRNPPETSNVDRDSTSSIVTSVQPESLSVDAVTEIDSAMLSSSLRSLTADVPANVAHLDNQTAYTALEVNSTMPPVSSSNGSSLAPRVSDADHGASRGRRRRRLR
ncbi:hypothetical protein Ddye_031938 [Dipteronia dyeriana]|uniref:E3 ubiquitin-protein ligase RMA n=1 Tax=Dipteronia dyeriana TaxID=168575 RepID=A0AAD9TJY2_9ROSI|nr:hypothetical protein Ddye_031938 [Dipteronia dyeriana]